jgi:hypothetical protein
MTPITRPTWAEILELYEARWQTVFHRLPPISGDRAESRNSNPREQGRKVSIKLCLGTQ